MAPRTAGASTASADSASAEGSSDGAWPHATPPVVDEGAPVTELQVRLPSGPLRLRLNRAHTVADLKAHIETSLASAGEAPRKYVLSSGFPPKPLIDDAVTLEAAGLISAAVAFRWT